MANKNASHVQTQPNPNLYRNTEPQLNVGHQNILSSAELEVYVEKERIMTVLNQILYKLQLAVCLPMLLAKDCELLQPLLTDKELSLISECQLTRFSELEKHNTNPKVQSNKKSVAKKTGDVKAVFVSVNDNTTKKLSVDLQSPKMREDSGMSKVIHMLYSKPRTRLRNIIRSKDKHVSPGCENFIKNFCELRNLTRARLNVSPAALNCRDRELRYAWRRNESAKLDIYKLMNKLELQKANGYSLVDTRDELIHNQHSKLAKQSNNLKFDIKKIVSVSEYQMVAQCNHNESKLQTLAHQVKENNRKYSSLLQENLQIEKELRAKRLKVESQLAAWLDKYDQDIGEKQDEWDEIKAGYEHEINEMCILQEEFDIQEDEYEKLMAEKEAEYRRELDEKMFIFICNRAARRIQRYWRAYRERKLSKKKRHKGKKGKSSGGKGK